MQLHQLVQIRLKVSRCRYRTNYNYIDVHVLLYICHMSTQRRFKTLLKFKTRQSEAAAPFGALTSDGLEVPEPQDDDENTRYLVEIHVFGFVLFALLGGTFHVHNLTEAERRNKFRSQQRY